MFHSKNRTKFFFGFIFLSLIFLYLRIKTLNHLLMWDEAWNILSLRAFLVGAVRDPFYWVYFYHPPLYMTFAKFLHPFEAGFAVRLECLSLCFSYATMIVTYLLSARIGGRKFAWFSALFLSLMPVSIAYDTWIKRDGLACLFGYLALFLLLKRKFFLCAVALSFSLLSKISAVFFIISATILIFIFKEKKPLKKLSYIYLTIVLMASWWYIFFSHIPEDIARYFLVSGVGDTRWINPVYYYVHKLFYDLGGGLLIFAVIGICYLSYLVFWKKKYQWSLPIVVLVSIYVPISFLIVTKSPWLSLAARPALAMMAAGGSLYLFEKSKSVKILIPLVISLLAVTFFTGISFSYPDYHKKIYPHGWPGANSSRELALYLNERMQDDDRLMITEFSYWRTPFCAVFIYYWRKNPIMIITGKETIDQIIGNIIKYKISWFVIVDSLGTEYNLSSLVKKAGKSALGNPEKVGWSYVWQTKNFWSE